MSTRDLLSDRALRVILALAGVLALNGLWWGWVECWNPDQMALRSLLLPGLHPFEPGDFLKPPFHTYLNFFLSVLPFKVLEKIFEAATGSARDFGPAILWWSRLIQVALFLGTILLVYGVTIRSSTQSAARIAAALIAISAGFILQAHFLTADIPVAFWMIASFLAAQHIAVDERMRTYVVTGLLVGIATATKYNALAVGLAIPIFHVFATRAAGWRTLLFGRNLVVGVAMVPLGFVLASPYSVISYQRFAADFYYNFVTTPLYQRELEGSGYPLFLLRIVEIIGWPVAVLTVVALVGTLYLIRRATTISRVTTVACLAVFLLYFWKFGGTPRVEVRFVLPIVPFLIIASAPAWGALAQRSRTAAMALLIPCICYGLLASGWVGYRFATDPRMAAQSWVAQNVPADAVIESSDYTPVWNYFPGVHVKEVRMPSVSARYRHFAKLFVNEPRMLELLAKSESDEGVDWYTEKSLLERQPDFISVDSAYYRRFFGDAAADYPEVRDYLQRLMDGNLGYEVAFDRGSSRVPTWLYPQDIAFVDNRILILRRSAH